MIETTQPRFRADKYAWLDARKKITMESLDSEVSEMPELIRQCGECVALANEIRDAVRVEVDQIKAQVAEELRTAPNNGKAPSESQIDSKIPLDIRYNKKLAELAEARQDASLWAILMEALRTKSSGIRVAADLITSGWLSVDYVRNKFRQEIRDVKK
jgi:hypothetical protein